MVGAMMPISETARVIAEFFDDQLAAGLVLPNGWFGRPYDDLHQLTGCTVAGDTMRIELDGQLILTFAGAGLVAVRDRDGLTVRGFNTLAWDWRPYLSPEEHHEHFSDGEVTFVAQLGMNPETGEGGFLWSR